MSRGRMSEALIDAVIEAQAKLIVALDGGDIHEIETTTTLLSELLARMRAVSAWRAREDSRERAGFALQQCDAAKRRVNYLSHRNRERIERLARIRQNGEAGNPSYAGMRPRLALVTV